MIQDEIPENIAFIGDWHGSMHQASHAIAYAAENGATHILHLGDFGIWRGDTPFLDQTQEILERHNIKLYFVDGNHENFTQLYEYPLAEDGTRPIRDNIFHLPRGFSFTWGDTHPVKFVALGGAYSVDRPWRTKNISYWEEELITEEDVQAAIANETADVLLCHDSPSIAPNLITDNPISQQNGIKFFGAAQIYNATQHRAQLNRVAKVLDPTLVVHGHYHAAFHYPYRSATGKTAYVIGLDQGQNTYVDQHLTVALFTLEEIKELQK